MDIGNKPGRKTLPRAGIVQSVRKEWIVHEDEALALQLQNQEIEAHYGGNRQRNRVVREDHPRARQEQEKEIEEALAIRNLQEQISRDQEEADASVARRLAEELEKEEEEQRRMNQFRDERVAKRMQNLHISDTSAPQSCWQREQAELSSHKRTYSGDGGSQMVPQASSSRDVTFTGRKSRNTQDHPGYFGASSLACHSSSTPPYPQKYGHPVANRYKLSDAVFSANSEPVEEEEFRHVQEEQDAELARLLQEVEQHKTSNRKGPSTSTIDHVEQLDRDRMLAIEVQDRELARILQEKEKARLRRAKERTKLKASLKKEGEITGQNSGERQRLRRGISPEESEFQQEEESRSEFSGRPPRRQDLNAIEVVSQNNPSDGNIATAIDPTYRNVMPTKDREFPKSRPLVVSTPGTSYSDRLRDEESEAPPYMPIAGQRRSLSLEKKKKGRDSCKQQ